LSGLISDKAFVELMNLEAKNLGLENTYFVNPSGLDPDDPQGPINYSTTQDLSKLAAFLVETKPKIMEISRLRQYNLYTADGVFHHKVISTDELLGDSADLRTGVIGGKTGHTSQAEGCLLLIVETPDSQGKIINVILGSQDRFGEMKKLVEWLGKAYKW
jgi:D-alanyl-D-alanine carboxypeptidase (penicillin-binding protein 5/6)